MSEKEYEALERFSIMTEQSDVSETNALRYVQKLYGKDIAVKIWERFVK